MEPSINPYEAGQAYEEIYRDSSSGILVTPVALGALMATKFWVSLVGVVTLIMVCINLLSFFSGGIYAGGGVFVALIIPLIMVILQLVLAVRLIQYGVAIGKLKSSRTNSELEQVIVIQSKFWNLFGVVCLLMLILMIVFWLIGVFMVRSAF